MSSIEIDKKKGEYIFHTVFINFHIAIYNSTQKQYFVSFT